MAGFDDPRYVQQTFQELEGRVKRLEGSSLAFAAQQKGPLPGWIRGGTIEAGRIIGGVIDVGTGAGAVSSIISTSVNGNPFLQVQSPGFTFVISPQLQVQDQRDPGTADPLVQIGDEQNAFDASLTLQRYSSISLAPGTTYPVDIFVQASPFSGALGIGALISRRAGLQWGGAGNWGVDISFPFRYHGQPSSVSLTTVIADSLNGGTKSVVDIDYFGFHLQIAGTAGGGFTLNRWTASGGT